MENDIYQFEFRDFRLLSIHFELKNNKEYKPTKDVRVSTVLSLKHDLLKDKKRLRLFMKLDICGDELPFSLGAEVGGLFVFPKTIKNASSLDKVARINCAAIVFPYLREIVADITRRANLPILNLPPVNFVENYQSRRTTKTKQLSKEG